MRSVFNWLLLFGVVLLTGCGGGDKPTSPAPPPPARPASLFRFHFLGTTRLAADTNAAPWVLMSELPASQSLWAQTRDKLAKAPYQFLQHRIGGKTNDHAGLFRELISDFLRAESFIEIAGDTNRIAESLIAVRLTAGRAAFWQTNLQPVLEDWTGQRAEALATGISGWQLQKHHEPNLIRFVRSGDWALIAAGQDQLTLLDDYLQRLKQSGNPAATDDHSWLELTLDAPSLAPAWSSAFRWSGLGSTPEPPVGSSAFTRPESPEGGTPNLGRLPKLELSLVGRDGNLRLKGDLSFREALPWRLEPWQIPTNLVHDPIISFTAVQGLAPVLKNHQSRLGLSLGAPPNQVFVWAGAHFPFQTLAAAPMHDAAKILHNMAAQLMDRYNQALQATNAGNLAMTTNASGVAALRWADIPPFVTPFLSTGQHSEMNFLFAGIHPNWSSSNSLPLHVLYHHLTTRTNLVYYDWEVTGAHAYSWRASINIFRHIFERPRLGPDTASIVWINSVSNRLGNTVTEITQTDSNRLALVRQGPIALTGLEIMALAHWLESPGFPLNGLALPARTNVAKP